MDCLDERLLGSTTRGIQEECSPLETALRIFSCCDHNTHRVTLKMCVEEQDSVVCSDSRLDVLSLHIATKWILGHTVYTWK